MNWYAIRVRPIWEKRVVAALELLKTDANGLDAYIPKETIKRRLHHGRLREYERPLITGYVFACLSDDMIAMIHEVAGVHGLVMSAGKPAVVPFAFLFEVRLAEQRGTFERIDMTPKAPRPHKRHIRRGKSKPRIKHAELSRLADFVQEVDLAA